ncbi:MAG: hypothetical protein WC852_03605 [Candidatus Nanoarchaeia archaeon]|jgi:hypothetical protein
MVNKKGTELSLNFIIIAAVVLVVLIVAILFFTGGASKLIGQQKEVQVMSEQERGLALATCQFACTTKDKAKYDNPSFSESVVKAGLANCAAFTELGGAYEIACLKECKKDSETSEAVCGGLTKGDCDRTTGCNWN